MSVSPGALVTAARLAAQQRPHRAAMDDAALAGVVLCLALLFGVLVPKFPIIGAGLTLLGPLCPMPAPVCGALGIAPASCGAVLTLELDESSGDVHDVIKGYLFLLWLVIPLGMQQSAHRGELFDLPGQMTFYKSYHSDPINVAIHAVCIPLILWTAIGLCSVTGPMIVGAPAWLDWSMFPALLYSSYYLRMAQPASRPLACLASALVLLGWMVHHSDMRPSFDTLLKLHIGTWLAQFWGHGVHERRECMRSASSLFLSRSSGGFFATPAGSQGCMRNA
jgi:uncharacterized membrane protein YGL010W